MKFTGERYLPSEAGQIRHEHMHRYAWCRQLVEGKMVLDVACGEGYGSAMLARCATQVIGVDIAPEAVAHASQTYAGQNNLEFRLGSATAIPLPDASVDVVVSFETIEHLDQQEEMISEIRRVLRPDGLLAISSPDRVIYSERAGYHNEFHVKELDFSEFSQLLERHFGVVSYYGQRLAVGSALFQLQPEHPAVTLEALTDTGESIVSRVTRLSDPVYFVALASGVGVPLPPVPDSVLFSEAEDLYTHHLEVAAWAQRQSIENADALQLIEKMTHAAHEVGEYAKQQELAAEGAGNEAAQAREALYVAQAEATQVREALGAVQFEAAQAHAALDSAQGEIARLSGVLSLVRGEAGRLNEELNLAKDEVVRLNGELSLAQGEVVRFDEALNLVQGEINLSRQELVQVRAESELIRTSLIEMRGEVAKRDGRIAALERATRELAQIKASRSWRWTRPVRVALRIARNGGRLSAADREQWRLFRKAAAPITVAVSATPNALETSDKPDMPDASDVPSRSTCLVTQTAGKRDVFLWAVIDWHFRIQRPQHLASELAAAGHRVFYVSNNFVDDKAPGFAVEALDDSGRLFRIQLHLHGSPAIYHAVPTPDAQQQLRAGIGQLLAWTGSRACLSLVQHPYWLETARILPNQRLIYDCMDHHGGFVDNSPEVLGRELDLMRTADLLVVTSDWLYEEAGKYNSRRLMIRNACQYEHFATRPHQVFGDKQGRRVIGYYGAIAEWFDLDLLEKVARRFSDCLILMVGADTTGAQQRLQHLDNVEFTGEVPYAILPFYLAGFDVCLLPFQVIPLTLATNPVKVYEYLSAGKDVVSVTLPEIRQFGDLVRTGIDHGSFLEALSAALAAKPDPTQIARRQQFAIEQTWTHRVRDLMQGVDALAEPLVSVIVVTYNNLDLTRVCLRSLELYSDYTNLEVIVVDNASADDTPAYLAAWAAARSGRQIVLNPDNRGFAAANNQGLAKARGEYLVMLNNDTHVTQGWIATLVAHLRRNKTLGMIGPVTNNIGNEARIDINYDDMDGMLRAAASYTTLHVGQLTPLRTAAFFCVMMPRAVYEKVGPLDEAFGIGFFEDDDYCRRVEHAGWSIACADDVFVHHNLSASFNKLKQETRQALFEQNKVIYETKWGTWVPHRYREP